MLKEKTKKKSFFRIGYRYEIRQETSTSNSKVEFVHNSRIRPVLIIEFYFSNLKKPKFEQIWIKSSELGWSSVQK